MKCKECGGNNPIVNKHFGLCQSCNNIRLHGSKHGKQYTFNRNEKKSVKPDITRLKHEVTGGMNDKQVYIVGGGRSTGKSLALYIADNTFYKKVFDESDHKCEECGCKLNDVFADDEGKVINRHRYSHIIPKSIAPHLRHNIKNINNLCLEDHTKWDFGDKVSMRIYEKNKKRFPEYF